MKRLFIVIANGDVAYFSNKMAAKEFRNLHAGAVVSRGPDHWKEQA